MLRKIYWRNFSRRKEENSWSSSPRKIWEVCKGYFQFLKAPKENKCQIIADGKAANQNDELGMKVPSSRLSFTAEEKFINILKERPLKLL